MKVGWAYLGIAAILVVLGFVIAYGQGHFFGDILLLLSIVFVYLGSSALADEDEAATLAERAK